MLLVEPHTSPAAVPQATTEFRAVKPTPAPELNTGDLTHTAQVLHAALEARLGVEGSIYLLDYVTRQHGRELSLDGASRFVSEMKLLRPVTPEAIAEAFSIVSQVPESDRSKTASLVKYSFTANLCRAVGLHVMNYGYRNGDSTSMQLVPEELTIRYGLKLYHHLVSGVALEDSDVVEVGSGLGAGAAYLARTRSPRSYTGIDLVPAHIAASRSYAARMAPSTAQFIQGDAEALPIGTKSMDVALNVESMHCYPHPERFLAEVHRVLRPGGSLHVADFFTDKHLEFVFQAAQRSGFRINQREDINSGVKAALAPHLEEIRGLGSNAPWELSELFGRVIVTRTFDEPASNWRNLDLRYWMLRFSRE